jgi:hypothetical protein
MKSWSSSLQISISNFPHYFVPVVHIPAHWTSHRSGLRGLTRARGPATAASCSLWLGAGVTPRYRMCEYGKQICKPQENNGQTRPMPNLPALWIEDACMFRSDGLWGLRGRPPLSHSESSQPSAPGNIACFGVPAHCSFRQYCRRPTCLDESDKQGFATHASKVPESPLAVSTAG